MVDGGLTDKVVKDKVGGPVVQMFMFRNVLTCISNLINQLLFSMCVVANRFVMSCILISVFLFQNLAFCFPDCGTIPPPVIMVQNVSFRYAEGKVSAIYIGFIVLPRGRFTLSQYLCTHFKRSSHVFVPVHGFNYSERIKHNLICFYSL